MIDVENTGGIAGELSHRDPEPAKIPWFVGSGLLTFHSQQACTNIVIMGESGEVGRLSWDNGQFTFSGEMAESAQIFFDDFVKPLVDSYMRTANR